MICSLRLVLICASLAACTTAALADWGEPLWFNQFDAIDTRTGLSWRTSGSSYYYLCADDFISTQRAHISEIRVAGVDDPYPLGVDILFWADVPATPTEDSHPGQLLYIRHLDNADSGDPHKVGWYIVGDGTFRIDLTENDWFYTEGSPEAPVVYWVGVQVYHDIFGFEHFHWKFRNPNYQTSDAAVYSTDGTTWSHWGEISGSIQNYSGTLPSGWRRADLSFQLYGQAEPPLGQIRNTSFEIEHADYMPEGGWAGPLPYRGMPNNWAWRRQGHVNGHGEATINNPAFNWASDGYWALYMFASNFGEHYAGDYLEFYQTVDLSGVDQLLFDVYLKGGAHCDSYFAIDDDALWRASAAGTYYDQSLAVTGYSGLHELRLGVMVREDFGATADGHTFFDNLRARRLPRGDLNCDGVVNNQDIDHFVQALFDAAGYEADHDGSPYPPCSILMGDFTGDGAVNNQDIDGFVHALFGS